MDIINTEIVKTNYGKTLKFYIYTNNDSMLVQAFDLLDDSDFVFQNRNKYIEIALPPQPIVEDLQPYKQRLIDDYKSMLK
jgi:hypothetical protein